MAISAGNLSVWPEIAAHFGNSLLNFRHAITGYAQGNPYVAVQVVGRLADKPPAEGRPLAGLLVRHGYADSVMHPADLPLFTKLRPGRILQRQAVACSAPFSEV